MLICPHKGCNRWGRPAPLGPKPDMVIVWVRFDGVGRTTLEDVICEGNFSHIPHVPFTEVSFSCPDHRS